MKVIFHLDLDCYFVSVARVLNPRLNGKPVVVTAREKHALIVSMSYEAKEKGIKVPMTLWEAWKICPDVIATKPNFYLYDRLSCKIFEYMATYTKKIEVASIDEAYMDVTDIWAKYGSPAKLAFWIQKEILRLFKLPISIGISTTKFGAKMSTSINKPLGISITPPGKLLETIGDWNLIKCHGIGSKTKYLLNMMGIYKISSLASADPYIVQKQLGKRGIELINNVNEKGSNTIEISHNELKELSMSRRLYGKKYFNSRDINNLLEELICYISNKAKNRNLVGKEVCLFFRYQKGKNLKHKRKQITFDRPICSFKEFGDIIRKLFNKMWNGENIKFLRIHLGKLSNIYESTYQMSIFDDEHKESKIENIMYSTNSKFRKKVVVSGEEAKNSLKWKQNQSRYTTLDKYSYKKKK